MAFSGAGGKEREVIESHTLCLFIYQFHSNFKELGISPPHLKIFYFQRFLLKCRAEFLSRKKWQRAAALHLKVTKSPGLAEVGLSVWFLQELLWAHLPVPSAVGGIPGTEPTWQSHRSCGTRAVRASPNWDSEQPHWLGCGAVVVFVPQGGEVGIQELNFKNLL